MALPAVDEMFANALRELDKARTAMSEARDWVKSDTRPLGATRTKAQSQAVDTVLDVVGEVKNLIDNAKDAIWQARDEDTDEVT